MISEPAVGMPTRTFLDELPATRAAIFRRGEDYVLIARNCPYLNVALERPDTSAHSGA